MIMQTVRNIPKRMLQPFQKSLRYKLMLLMVVIAVMPLSFVTLFAVNTTRQSVSVEVIRSNESRMNWAAKYMDEKFSQVQSVAYSLMLDSNLFPNANGSYSGSSPEANDSYIVEKLRSLHYANNDNIAQITLYLKSRNRLFIVDKSAAFSTDQLNTPNIKWDDPNQSHKSVNRITNSTDNNFTIIRSMNRFTDQQLIGGVTLEVRWKMMNSVLDMIHSEPNSQVLLLDNEGNTMYNPYSQQVTIERELMKKVVSNPTEPGYMQLKQGFLFYKPVVSGQLWIIKWIPISYVTKGAYSTLYFSFYTAIIFILLAIAVSITTAYYTTKPIIRLTKSMKAVEYQNFDVGVSEVRSDEIGTLERRFNTMLQRIKELIQIEYKSKIEKRTAQIKVMQAQINPHFLYNALQSIGGIALSRDVPEIYKYVGAISDLFRYTIKMKSDVVTVADEIEHVKNYLQIQKLRFEDMLEVKIDVDEECKLCQIPKFSLQPIVENCFVHGLEGKMDKWAIKIHAQIILDELEISIEDNGLGIGQGRLEQIRKHLAHELENPELGESLGMSNVNSRIKLIFGEEYGLFVSSSDGGTIVKVVIPALPQQGEEM